jgi:hypothetical protein
MSTPDTFNDWSGVFAGVAVVSAWPPVSAIAFGVSEGLGAMSAGITCGSEGADSACIADAGYVAGGAPVRDDLQLEVVDRRSTSPRSGQCLLTRRHRQGIT